MSTGDYLIGVLGLAAIVVSLGLAARTARRILLPDLSGAPALLADSILGIAAFVLLSELLGLVGLLDGVLLVVASLLLGAATFLPPLRTGPDGPQTGTLAPRVPGGPLGPATTAVATAIALLVALQWAAPTLLAWDRGIYGGDSLWYHLPFAAHIAQTGSVTQLLFTDPLYLNWFYPQNSELLHAGGILLFGNDFLSPVLNLGWLGLALLAGWCIGRPHRAGAATLAAVAALMSANLLFSRQPGNANNDVVAIALLLSSAALLINASLVPRTLAVAGLAAGLALGTKLTVVVPVAALTLGVIVLAERGTRWKATGAWGVGLLAGGGYWYIRNLVVAGNPFPWVHLGPLPKAGELEGRDPFSIAHYLTDTDVWGKWFVPGLHERLGDLWPLALALAVAGVAVALFGGRPVERMLAAVALVSAIAYMLTPLSAAGPEGMPVAFRLNIRYLAPALALALPLLAIPPAFARGRERLWVGVATGAFAALVVFSNGAIEAIELDRLPGEVLLALAAVGLPVGAVMLARRGVPMIAVAAGLAASVVVLAVVGRFTQDDYLDWRYSSSAPDYPRNEHPSIELGQGLGAAYDWARDTGGERVALSGTEGALFQYGLWGGDSSNRVRFVGRRGDHGSFEAITDCPGYVAAINDGDFDYLVTTPDYDQDHPESSRVPAQRAWLSSASAAERVAGGELVDVWRLDGALDPSICTTS